MLPVSNRSLMKSQEVFHEKLKFMAVVTLCTTFLNIFNKPAFSPHTAFCVTD
jgi:hypothetical protein